jgi:hypothetical protein
MSTSSVDSCQSGAEEDVGAAQWQLRGTRFRAPGLEQALRELLLQAASAAVAPWGLPPPQHALVRPLQRSPLLAALGGAASDGAGGAAVALGTRRKPRGALKRLKRALRSELAWHARASRHAARALRRCLTPRCAPGGGAGAPGTTGKAFRLVRAASWLDGDADGAAAEAGQPQTAIIVELCLDFGLRGGRAAAAAFRATMRDGAAVAALEAELAAALAELDAAQRPKDAACSDGDAPAAALGVRATGRVLCALLDDQPFARLDAHRAPGALVADMAKRDAAAAGDARSHGMSAAVAARLQALLALCLKERRDKARRVSVAATSAR